MSTYINTHTHTTHSDTTQALFPILYVNRWNTLNGKAGGLGILVAAGNTFSIAYKMDGGTFDYMKPRMWHGVTVMFVLAALHLMFNANAMHTSASLAIKEKERAAKKQKKM